MKHLLDVNLLIAGIVETHPKHLMTRAWLREKEFVLCPISQLGFLRIGSHPKAIGLTMARAREVLNRFISDFKVDLIPDDLPALGSHPRTSDQVTDHYLADLAAKHGLKLATLDEQLKHPSAELVR